MILLRRKSLFWRDTIQTTLKLGLMTKEAFTFQKNLKIRLLSLLVKVVMVSFEDTGDIQKECDRLKDKVKFSSTQSFEIVPVTQVNSQVLIIGIVFILLFIFISGLFVNT